jgi:hypothetical protein
MFQWSRLERIDGIGASWAHNWTLRTLHQSGRPADNRGPTLGAAGFLWAE